MKKLELVRSKKEKIVDIAATYGISNIRTFGSVARDEDTYASDLDLLIDLAPGRSALELGGFLVDLEELLHCRVDLVTEKGLNPLIKENVLKEVVNL